MTPNTIEDRVRSLERQLEIFVMESKERNLMTKAISLINDLGIILIIVSVVFRSIPVLMLILSSLGVLVLCFGFRIIKRLIEGRMREVCQKRGEQ